MKAHPRTLAKVLQSPDPSIRLFLFHGYDPGQSRALAEQLASNLGAEKVPMAAQALKNDPGALADEAGAIGLFGGRRVIWIDPAGDEISEAVEALLAAPAVESVVIAVAGPLRKTSTLLGIGETDPNALSHQSRELREADVERMVEEMATREGLRLAAGVAERIAAAAGGDRGIIGQELAKLATFVGAEPGRPVVADADALEAVGAGNEGDSGRLGDLALAGDVRRLALELAREPAIEAIGTVRAIQRRLSMLAPLRAQVDSGKRPHDVVASAGKSVFFKEKALVTNMISAWDSARLARVSERIGELERRLMRSDSPPDNAGIAEELIAIARMGARR